MTHILEVVNMHPNKRGPVELQLSQMARQARDRGWAMTLCFPVEPPDWYAAELAETGCRVRIVGHLDTEAGVHAVLRELPPDEDTVVHLHFVRPRLYVGPSRRMGAGALVRTEHTFLPRGSRVRALVRAHRYRGLDVTIACSQYIAAQTRREYLIRSERLRVVLNGVDLERFRPRENERAALRRKWLELPPEAYVMTVAAHFIPRKRIDVVIRALPAVLGSVPHAHLVLAGNGPELNAYRELVAELGLQSHVQILTGDNLVNEIYAASDVAVLTSWGEGLPGSGMEALATGLPLIASAAPGLDEVPEHEVSGLLVESEPPAVAAAIVRLARDEALRRRMSAAARARAEACFDVKRAARETLDVYAELIPRAPGGTRDAPR